ncbi:hypothetical protein [Portibacter lacus]|uniref:Uncharacterized protein n=1 Tax=Portibacter lacus TaxID=1099794 RepID=A0AA37SR34_9BACT|nr:hypothetical protein [Portibacter lacus]GLR18307.1 hypothetical protein GCM10007940_29230 [Portibacter lacus]
MLGKVKSWLGIEGVKMEIETPEKIKLMDGIVKGSILFQSMTDKKVTKLKVELIEKYSRGRGKSKLINEYKLGTLEINDELVIKANGQLKLDFKLLFNPKTSEMDNMGRNLLLRGPVALAKMIKGAKSVYRIEVEAKVPGTALHPIAKKVINFY